FAVTEIENAIAVQAKASADPWRVAQEHSFRLAPHGGAATWSGTFRFSATDPVDAAALSVPPGFRIERMEPASLFPWFKIGGDAMRRFSKPMTGDWIVRATGRFDVPAAVDGQRGAIFKPFVPVAGSAGICLWSFVGEKGLGVEFVRDPSPN